MRLILATILLLNAVAANAIPVTWELQDIIFNDGATASGSFIYDADLDAFSNINVVTTSSEVIEGSTYTEIGSSFAGPGDVYLGVTYNDNLVFELQEDMSNSGGTISVVIGCGFTCGSFETEWGLYRNVSSGSISSVPVPAAVWLFGSGLGLLHWFRRRQTA
jgi:hypothetical protein